MKIEFEPHIRDFILCEAERRSATVQQVGWELLSCGLDEYLVRHPPAIFSGDV